MLSEPSSSFAFPNEIMKPSEPLSPAAVLRTLLQFEFSSFGGSEERSRILKDFATREFNAILWIFLIATIFLLLTKLVSLFSLWSKAKLIPGPPHPSLFYGHSKLISRENLNEILSDSHNKYGSVIKLWLGPSQLLVSIKEPEIIKEILLKAEDKLPLTGRAFRLAFGQLSLFVSSFVEVKRSRESLATELSERVLKGAHVQPIKFEDCIIERMQKFITKESVDCKMISQHIAFTLLGYLVFGDAFLDWPKANVYEEFLMMISKDACFWASYRVIPFWKLGFWNYQSLCTKLKRLTQELVHLCKEKENPFFLDRNCYKCNGTSNIGTRIPNCVSSCSDGKKPVNFLLRGLHGHHTAEEELYGNIMGVMFHGSLALSGLISNIIVRLAENPEIQYKIYTEIRMAKKVSMNDEQQNVDKTPVLLGSIYESARLLPSCPLLQRCSLDKDLILKTGITIPAGTVLVVPVQLIQMDDSTWGTHADEFNPYRFLSSSGQSYSMKFKNPRAVPVGGHEDSGQRSFVLNEPIGSAAFLSFGSGCRACIGQKLAIQGVAALLASLIGKYEIRTVSGSNNDLKPAMCSRSLLSSPKIVFVSRTAEDTIKT